jgi:hypothetical protein
VPATINNPFKKEVFFERVYEPRKRAENMGSGMLFLQPFLNTKKYYIYSSFLGRSDPFRQYRTKPGGIAGLLFPFSLSP